MSTKKIKLNIYIGFDSTNYGQQLAYDVCERSIRRNSNYNINIIKLVKKELIDKKLFWRKDNTGVTEFTYTRFLVPYLNNYEDWAVFCDSDFLWNCDILDQIEKSIVSQKKWWKKAVYCVHHDYKNCNGRTKMDGRPQEFYPKKNWSSLMVFNCSHPSTKNLTLESVANQTPAWLHRMQWANEDQIGKLDKKFNYLVGYYDDLKFDQINALHFTDGGPWHPGYENVEFGDEWSKYVSYFENEKMVEEREILKIELEKNKKVLKEFNYGKIFFKSEEDYDLFFKTNDCNREEINDLFKRYYLPKTNILDIGSANGYYTISFANISRKCNIYSYEPIDFELLEESILNNSKKIKNCVKVNKYGLGNKPKELQFKSKKLDDLKLNDISFIRAQLNGNEIIFLKGATNTLKNNNITIVLEIVNYYFKIVDLLKNYGYYYVKELNSIKNNFIFRKEPFNIKTIN